MNHSDVCRREAQRDFADGSGVMARGIVEGLFGINPHALSGVLELRPGLPPHWQRASLTHPNLRLELVRDGAMDRWTVTQVAAHRFKSLKLRVPATHERVASVTVNGQSAEWHADSEAVGRPMLQIQAPLNASKPALVQIQWAGAEFAQIAHDSSARQRRGHRPDGGDAGSRRSIQSVHASGRSLN